MTAAQARRRVRLRRCAPNPIRPGRRRFDPEEMDRYIHLKTDIDELNLRVAQALPGLDPQPGEGHPRAWLQIPRWAIPPRPAEHRGPRVVVAGRDSGHGSSTRRASASCWRRSSLASAHTARRTSWTQRVSPDTMPLEAIRRGHDEAAQQPKRHAGRRAGACAASLRNSAVIAG
jgi:hypothetical protein